MEEVLTLFDKTKYDISDLSINKDYEQDYKFPVSPKMITVDIDEQYNKFCKKHHVKKTSIAKCDLIKEPHTISDFNENILELLLSNLDNHYSLITKMERDRYLEIFLQEMCKGLIKENYKILLKQLSKKVFSLAKLEKYIIGCKMIIDDDKYNMLFYAYLSEFLRLNLILLNKKCCRWLGRYVNKRRTIIIFNRDDKYSIIFDKKNNIFLTEDILKVYISGKSVKENEILYDKKQDFKIKKITLYKIAELQKIAKLHDIPFTKISTKTKKEINITKKQLYEKIKGSI